MSSYSTKKHFQVRKFEGTNVRVFSRRNRPHQGSEQHSWWSRSSFRGDSASSSIESRQLADSFPKAVVASPASRKSQSSLIDDSDCGEEHPRGGSFQRKGGSFRIKGSIHPLVTAYPSFVPASTAVPFYPRDTNGKWTDRRMSCIGPCVSSPVADMSNSMSRDMSLDEPEFCFIPTVFHPLRRPPFFKMIDCLDSECLVSNQMMEYFLQNQQSVKTFQQKLSIRDYLFRVIRDEAGPQFEKCGMYIVGSSLNGFGSDGSDLDICLMVQMNEISKEKALSLLGDVQTLVEYHEVHKSLQLIEAKKPILRMELKEQFGSIQVDLNANNPATIQNTHLLHYYAQFDWRVRPLTLAVKQWATTIGINDSRNGTFTSYSLILLVIHYLQRGVIPAVLPNLHYLYPSKFCSRLDVRALNTNEPLDPYHTTDLFNQNNMDSLGKLFVDFLRYYKHFFSHAMDKLAVSVRTSELSRSHPSLWPSDAPLFIEEPFSQMNTAHAVFDRRIFNRKIIAAFEESWKELQQNWDFKEFLSWAEDFRKQTEREESGFGVVKLKDTVDALHL